MNVTVDRARRENMGSQQGRFWKGVASFVVPIAVLVGIGWGLLLLFRQIQVAPGTPLFSRPEVMLTLMTVGGLIALLAAVSLVAAIFAAVGLADSKQALGLPEGSVRAIIALGLIVVFVIGGAYFYSDLSTSGAVTRYTDLLPEEVNAFASSSIVSKVPSSAPGRFDIVVKTEKSPVSQDIAKQILTAIITLVTAVSAFYFGTRALGSAVGARGGAPTLKIIEPKERAEFKPGSPLTVVLKSTPPGEAVIWEVPHSGRIEEVVPPSVYKYTGGSEPSGVTITLKCRLSSHSEVTDEVTIVSASDASAATAPTADLSAGAVTAMQQIAPQQVVAADQIARPHGVSDDA